MAIIATYVIRVQKHPGPALAKIVSAATGQAGRNRVLLFEVGKLILDKVQEAFAVKSLGGTDAAGLRWAPLSTLTLAARKRKKRNTTGILTESGELFRSLTPPSSASGRKKHQVFRIDKDRIDVGTERPFAWTHMKGIPGIPQRRLWAPPSHWPESWKKEIAKVATKEVVEIILKLLA